MPPFVNGLIFGFIFLLIVGPAFFALIQTSIQQGFRRAIFLALGISVSDTFYVVIVLLGLSTMLQDENIEFWLAVFGSIALVAYAIYSWFKSPKVGEEEDPEGNQKSYAKNFLKGLLLNGLNPLIIVFWATWVSTITIQFNYEFDDRAQFFGGMLVTILSMDIGKAYIAHKLKHLITVKFVQRMNRSIAVILLLFTVQIFVFLYQNYA